MEGVGRGGWVGWLQNLQDLHPTPFQEVVSVLEVGVRLYSPPSAIKLDVAPASVWCIMVFQIALFKSGPFSRAVRIYPTYPPLQGTQEAQMRQQWHRQPKTLHVGTKPDVPERYAKICTMPLPGPLQIFTGLVGHSTPKDQS